MEKYVIGLDYGSDSARAIVVNALTGETLATAVKYYPRWKEGKYCNPAINQYRQHPQDYIDVLEASVKEALAACPAGTAEKVVGIAFDTTGSTPAFTDATGTPLALLYFGKITRQSGKLPRSINFAENGISIIRLMKEESIRRNGFGQKLYMYFAKMSMSGRKHIRS